MQAPNPIESPIVNADDAYDYDVSCSCSASIPPGSRMLFAKLAAISMFVCSVLMYGLYRLLENAGWL
jgi:hypothetical protein